MTSSGECVVERGECGSSVGEGKHLVPFLTEKFADRLDHGQLVIDQQHFGHCQ